MLRSSSTFVCCNPKTPVVSDIGIVGWGVTQDFMEEGEVLERQPPVWWAGYVPAALLVGFLLYLLVTVGGSILIPLLLAFALTFMLEPLTVRLQAGGRSRSSAVLLTLLTAVLVLALVLVFLLPSVYHQLLESVNKLPLALRAVAARAQRLLSYAQEHLSPEMYGQLQSSISNFEKQPTALVSRIGTWLSKGLLGLVNVGSAAVGLVIVPFFVYYLLLDLDRLKNLLEDQIPIRYRGVGAKLFDEVGEVLRGYVRGRFLIACIMAAIYSTGLLILRVPLWAGIGLIAGVVGIIPYLGVTSGFILAMAFAALDRAGAGRLIGVAVVFAIAQMTEDYVLTPRIIGGKLALHPMLVFIALIIAGDLYGLLGLVLAIPALAVIKVFVKFFDELYLRSSFYRAPAVSPSGRIRERSTAQEAADSLVSPHRS